MELIDAATLRALVPMDRLLDAIEAAYRDVAAGRDRSPLRQHLELTGGGLLVLMPAVREGGSGAAVKLITWVPGNPERGLPTIQGTVTWFDAVTGEAAFQFDGPAVTALRTGAASGVGARLLARPDASVMALIGAGVQAEPQIRAVLAARPIREVRVYARTREPREAFAAAMDVALPTSVRAADSAEEAVRGADIVCCVTPSETPVFEAEWLEPGTHVNAIGAFRLGMVEIPADAFGRASLVAVDSREAVGHEAGDVAAAIAAGMISEADLVEIGTVAADWAECRDPAAITIFKSVGLPIQDLATADLAVAAWRAGGGRG
ncbi:MAG TPA: ornithine cyclodeaminase family protein [Candidatus Limnocylindria bacterium]|jgi:ornithine cyclodeaminase|nr:ornithine cyclodeaminase family protein [Candidatus Limnocylindria bacterium]